MGRLAYVRGRERTMAKDNNSVATAETLLPRVLVLATGGTISGTSDERSAIGYDAGGVMGAELVAGVQDLDDLARLQVEQIANIASQNMNASVWFQLAERIRQAWSEDEADAVVIIHGTDTLEETAFFLDTILPYGRPVVLTGAMPPATALGADGPANLYEAVKVAASPLAHNRGVLAVLNGDIHAARRVSKTHTTALQTFRSLNGGPVGFVDAETVRFVSQVTQQGKPAFLTLPARPVLPSVEIVFAHAGMEAHPIDRAVADGVRGLVVAGMGDGNVSEAALGGLDRAVAGGVMVVRASRVTEGFVNRNVEIADDRHGLVASLDLNPQKARILLQLLLANDVTAPKDVQRMFLASAGGAFSDSD
ncbi:L-asparaginase II [Acetobacter estunensis NRIC 0472]|uniref:Type II asparaginase n=2 Tax=Acetobacter estunensis TaxID=104097 RepID=A0A967B2F6_9PROT|nr:type II asparaginase [Acetobacter estunensis]GBQ26098.1 L-asparaginase II [Acetobacter estunensis NRIC 0472]